MYFDNSIISRIKKERSPLRLLYNRLFFPFIAVMPDSLCLRMGLTPLDEERVIIVNKYIAGRFLDIGCGTNIFKKIRGNGIGIDVYPWAGTDFVVDDTVKLNFEDGEFDSVLIVAALNHIPERDKVLLESYRVLKPGGKIILTMLTPFISYITHKIRYFYDEDQTEREIKNGEIWGISRKQMYGLLDSAGFKEIFSEGFVYGLNRIYIGYKK
ncbi:MAG: methyltransferase domain-containing protein [Bacteroidetes bacterium]|nr:methyltransferase domain-containing protein [Bacteroidota bacterium]